MAMSAGGSAATSCSIKPPHFSCTTAYHPFCNTTLPESTRLDNLLSLLTVEELVGQLFMDADLAYGNTTITNSTNGDLRSTSVPRLGLAQFNYMGQGNIYRGASNGCDLNCCTGGKPPCIIDKPFASVLPQGTGLAATFDAPLAFAAGVLVSDESRSLQTYNANRTVEYRSGASSVINIARDPRWGRVPETYGECPSLTGTIALGFNKGLLGFSSYESPHPPRVLKTLPVIRHLGAYAGPDHGRFLFDALVTEPDLELTYLPAWRTLVENHALAGAMSAISSLNGVPGIAHQSLLRATLKGSWRFDGYVISDCDTFPSLLENWDWAGTKAQAAASALKAGNDINCGPGFASLLNATRRGYTSRKDLEVAARRALTMRMRVGELQPPQTDPWRVNAKPLSEVGGAAHVKMVERIVSGGTVLLHHKEGTLPIGPSSSSLAATSSSSTAIPSSASAYRIALIGPAADNPSIQAHTYHGTPSKWLTIRQALLDELPSTLPKATLHYAMGAEIDSYNTSGFQHALRVASSSDVIIYCGGLHAAMEEEDTDRMRSLGLPGVQLPLLRQLRSVAYERNVPLIAILISGGPLAVPTLTPPSYNAPDALLWLSYFGMSARPLAKILLGTEYPSGRLPFTVPHNESLLPPITDYSMTSFPGRTYRYLDDSAAPPLYPFGHGLSLTRWKYTSSLQPSKSELTIAELEKAANEPCTSTAAIAFTTTISLAAISGGANGPANATTSVLLFGALEESSGPKSPFPRKALLAFTKPTLSVGGKAEKVELRVCARDLTSGGLGVHRMPLPNKLLLWVGDAAKREVEAVVELKATEEEEEPTEDGLLSCA